MSPEATARILVALELEQRSDRPYDEQDAGHVIHPNGSLCDSFCRAFLGAAAREALTLYANPQRSKEHAA